MPILTTQLNLHGSLLDFKFIDSRARGGPSPYYNDSHRKLRDAARKWVEDNLMMHVTDWEENGEIPAEIYRKMARDGLLMPCAAGSKIPQEWSKYPIIGGVKWDEWDGFHDYILTSEIFKTGGLGVGNGLISGLVIGLPPIWNFGSKSLQDRILPSLLTGEKRCCLAITEPSGGSDVANLETIATKSEDGKYYIVTGQKKFITNGIWADYFTAAVRTGGSGRGGISFLLIPRTEGVSTRKLKMSGGGSSGTTLIDFDEVKVPVENLIGKEGDGFRYIMYNFNHERLWIAFQSIECARVCIEDSIKFAMKRETFGKKLIDHPVIRNDLGHMIRETEALHAWIESIIFQVSQMSKEDGNVLLGGVTAMLKAHSGIVAGDVVYRAVQCLGGIGLTRGGQGERVERVYRDISAITIPGGAQNIMLDLGVREGLKVAKLLSKV